MLIVLYGAAALIACRENPVPAPVVSATSSVSPSASVRPEKPSGPSLLTEKPLRGAVLALSEKVGGDVKALELRVHPSRVVLQAQDPKRPSNVDQYVYRNGKVSDPVPVKLQGTGKLEDNLFALNEVKLATIPPLAGRALTEMRLEEGHVSFVSIKRDLPRAMDIRVRVKISSPRKDAFYDTDLDGNPLGEEQK